MKYTYLALWSGIILLSTMAFTQAINLSLSTKKHETKEAKSEDKEDQDLNERFFLQRNYPDKVFDMNAYDKAIQSVLNHSKDLRSPNGFNNAWQLEGPENIGGRFNVLTINPDNNNVMYAGSATGGVFKTTNGGATWVPIFDEQPYLAIGCITLDPIHPDTVYVGTGDVNISGMPFIGDGIYRSFDGGSTWTHLGLTDQRIISGIKINPHNTQEIYAGTMGLPMLQNNLRGLYKSIDGGISWTQSLYINDSTGIIDMEMDKDHPDTLYAVTWDRLSSTDISVYYGYDANIYKTTNGGTTWKVLNNGLPAGDFGRISITMSGSNSQVLYCSYTDNTSALYGIYKTVNGGNSWNSLSGNGLNQPFSSYGWYFNGVVLNPYDDNQLWLGGVDLWLSTDDGNDWNLGAPSWITNQVHADHHEMAFTKNAVFTCTDGGLYKTSDGGNNWVSIANIPNNQFYRITTNPWSPGTYVGGVQDNGTTGGNASNINNWTTLYGGDGFQPRINAADADYIYYELPYGDIQESYDGGYSFNDVGYSAINASDPRNWDAPYMISTADPYTLYIATNKVYSYSAGSGYGIPISNDLTNGIGLNANISALDESAINPNYLFAGTSDGNVWRTLNTGSSWDNITGNLPNRYVSSIHPSPANSSKLYVTHSGYSSNEFIPHIHRSDDNGNTWIDISGDLPQIGINDVFVLPHYADSILFVGTDGGVYATTNSGLHWQHLGTGMPVQTVYDVEFDSINNKLLAATYGRSLMSYSVDSLLLGSGILTGIAANSFKPSFKLFPNPASNELNILLTNNLVATCSIFNYEGKQVKEFKITSGKEKLNVNDLTDGLYLLEVKEGDKKLTQKITIVHI